MSLGGAETGLQADALAMIHEPFGASAQIVPVLRLGGNTGKTHILTKLADEARFVLFEVIEDSLHA